MPTYEYRCPNGHDSEQFFRKISDAPAELQCSVCGAEAVRRVSGGAGLLFKGSGFYLTDYGKNAHRKSGSESGTSDGKSEGKAESKTESKTESKSDSAKTDSGSTSSSAAGSSSAAKSDSGKASESKASSTKSAGGDSK